MNASIRVREICLDLYSSSFLPFFDVSSSFGVCHFGASFLSILFSIIFACLFLTLHLEAIPFIRIAALTKRSLSIGFSSLRSPRDYVLFPSSVSLGLYRPFSISTAKSFATLRLHALSSVFDPPLVIYLRRPVFAFCVCQR